MSRPCFALAAANRSHPAAAIRAPRRGTHRGLVGHRRLTEGQPAVADGSSAGCPGQPHVRAASAAMSSRSWRCCSSGTGSSPGGSSSAPASRMSSAAPSPSRPSPPATPTMVWSMRSGKDVDHPRSPHLERDAGRLGEGPHRPVVVDVHVLQHVRHAVDDDPLEADTGLRVAVEHRRPVGGAGEELVERRGDRARDRTEGARGWRHRFKHAPPHPGPASSCARPHPPHHDAGGKGIDWATVASSG